MVGSTHLTAEMIEEKAKGEHDDATHQEGIADGPVELSKETKARLAKQAAAMRKSQEARFEKTVAGQCDKSHLLPNGEE